MLKSYYYKGIAMTYNIHPYSSVQFLVLLYHDFTIADPLYMTGDKKILKL